MQIRYGGDSRSLVLWDPFFPPLSRYIELVYEFRFRQDVLERHITHPKKEIAAKVLMICFEQVNFLFEECYRLRSMR